LVAAGRSGAQIAEDLVLSPETVRTHIRNAMAKLGASSRAHAVALAVQRHEIDGQPSLQGDGAPKPPQAEPGARPGSVPGAGRARARADLAAGKSDATLSSLLEGLVSLYDVDGGTIFLADDDGLSLRRAALMGAGPNNGNGEPRERIPLGEGALGRAALERRAQLIHGTSARGGLDGRDMILAPMLASGRLVGVICLSTRPSRLTGRGELLLLQAFANRVGELLLGASGDPGQRLNDALDRFRTSWSAASGAV
jgi:Bacterial regulatory proteins, luxR family/GAF domain